MGRDSFVSDIGEWLVDQALSDPNIIEMFNQVCHRLYASGIPLARARLTWPTLHPLFTAETIVWHRGHETEFEQFVHQDDVSDAWLASPMKYMLDNDIEEVRRHLDGPNKMIDFPVLEELIEIGMTDYLMVATSFSGNQDRDRRTSNGLLVSWAADREGGFSDDDIVALKRIQRRFAAACKTAVQSRIASNITETYLGKNAGQKVLSGQIKLGDGHETNCVIWYTDMRQSTALADTMPPEDFLSLLNRYFAATAGSAIAHGGEILDFIGDAVLAIFPFDDESGRHDAVFRATCAARNAMKCMEEMNEKSALTQNPQINFGVAIHIGTVMFGNIGVDTRLSFSVIGPSVNEVERIETLTKSIGESVLASSDVASEQPGLWQSVGFHKLAGRREECELFAPKDHASFSSPSAT